MKKEEIITAGKYNTMIFHFSLIIKLKTKIIFELSPSVMQPNIAEKF